MIKCSVLSPHWEQQFLSVCVCVRERDEAMCAPASVKFSPSARAVQSHRASLLRIDEEDHGDNN